MSNLRDNRLSFNKNVPAKNSTCLALVSFSIISSGNPSCNKEYIMIIRPVHPYPSENGQSSSNCMYLKWLKA